AGTPAVAVGVEAHGARVDAAFIFTFAGVAFAFARVAFAFARGAAVDVRAFAFARAFALAFALPCVNRTAVDVAGARVSRDAARARCRAQVEDAALPRGTVGGRRASERGRRCGTRREPHRREHDRRA